MKHAAIAALPGGEAVLNEQAPTGGLDPRGSEEAGMAGLQLAAPVKPGDCYLLVNDRDEDMEAYDHDGQLLMGYGWYSFDMEELEGREVAA